MTQKLVGQTFGRWTVLEYAGSKYNNKVWKCRCQCGTEKVVIGWNLINGKSRSCGCLNAEIFKEKSTKHGQASGGKLTPEYRSWKAMLARCYQPKNKAYKEYGGRGIKVCESWKEDFGNFFRDMGEKPSAKHSIERKDVNKDYGPDNCRWATSAEQAHNRRVQHNNKAGIRGIYQDKNTGKWIAVIGVNGKQIYLGYFHDIESAKKARIEAEQTYWRPS